MSTTPNQSPAPDWADEAAQEIIQHTGLPSGYNCWPVYDQKRIFGEHVASIICKHAPPPASAQSAQQGGESLGDILIQRGKLEREILEYREMLCAIQHTLNEADIISNTIPEGVEMLWKKLALSSPAPAASLTDEAQGEVKRALRSICEAATDKAGDVMTDPTWNLDYSFEFTLTVKQLRQLNAMLATLSKKENLK